MSEGQAQQLFLSIQNKLIEDERNLNVIHQQIATIEREVKSNQLILSQIKEFDNVERTFKSVGKMFVFTPVQQIEKENVDTTAKNQELLQALKKKAKFLENKVNDTRSHLKDVLHSRA
ncbi:hypothetical protein K502DRAFT_365734 [Neoconidiobolus thromboides FSU 785]|nr:hypothetical protein K502DRAFT_365734 [Neoconidiobolus thromboides FSU 785]